MPSLRTFRQNTVCCFSLKNGCKILATLELLLPPVYIVSAGIPFDNIPEFLLAFISIYYFAVLTLFWGTSAKCCMNTSCTLILSLAIRVLVIFGGSGWALYMMGDGIGRGDTNAIVVNLVAFIFALVFGVYTWLCTWSYYLELTENPRQPQPIINVQISVGV